MKVEGLEKRFFAETHLDASHSYKSTSSAEVRSQIGDGLTFKEDTFLTSANLCRWVIDFNDISIGKQVMIPHQVCLLPEFCWRGTWRLLLHLTPCDDVKVGLGSYGVVYKGMWKGIEVAVKRFIKQQLDERRMLEFRAEIAFLSELQHPNIVLLIGAYTGLVEALSLSALGR